MHSGVYRSIIEAHGGQFCASNHSSFGSAQFFFTLPASDQPTRRHVAMQTPRALRPPSAATAFTGTRPACRRLPVASWLARGKIVVRCNDRRRRHPIIRMYDVPRADFPPMLLSRFKTKVADSELLQQDWDCRVQILPTVSIVEDDEAVRLATVSLVRSLGWQTCSFASAEAFLTSPKIDETSFLICDVRMPGMSGIELQGRLLDLGYRFPLVFVTAYPTSDVQEKALANGAWTMLSKPVASAVIAQLIEKALGKPTKRAGG